MDKIIEFQRKARENIHLITDLVDEMSNQEISQLVHELWMHQIQIESQNDELHKQQRQLETARTHFQDLYMYAPIGCCMFDKDGFVREANETIAAQLGVEREHLLHAKFQDFLAEADRETFTRHLKATFTTKRRQMDFVSLLAPSRLPLDVRLDSIPGTNTEDHGEQCWTAIIDISERRQTVNQLKNSEERLLQVIQRLPIMIIAFDERLLLSLWNRECEQISGYRAQDIVLNPNVWHLLFPNPAYRQQTLSTLQRQLNAENLRNWEWDITCQDGTPKTILWSVMSKQASIPGWHGWALGVDLTEKKREQEGLKQSQTLLEQLVKERTLKLAHTTRQLEQEAAERKRMDEALRISEQQYRLLAEHVSDGIAMLRDDAVLFANTPFLTLFGYTAPPLFPIPLTDLIREDARKRFEATLRQFEKGVLEHRFEISLAIRDGRDIWLQGAHRAIEWQGMPAILLTVRDITTMKRRELTLEQEKKHLQHEIFTLKSSMKDRYKFGEIVGKSAVMQTIYEQILKAAASDASVFIYGESGTGKELIARTIHKMSKRREERFIPINCGAIPETLFESEFFGHRKGSFTGAFRDKQGFFSAAHKGTLFLDELGELTPAMQVKLLRVLDDGEYTPVGDTTLKKVDVRIIAATNRNLEELRQRGLIREDFFFRVHVFTITVPPLRKRKEDIPLLVDHCLRRYRAEGEPLPTIPAHIMEEFYTYDWPGNIREFQNAIQRYLSGQPLEFLQSPPEESLKANALSSPKDSRNHREFQAVMDEFEKKLILNVLEQHRWNKSKTAAALGIPRRTLYRKMERYGIA